MSPVTATEREVTVASSNDLRLSAIVRKGKKETRAKAVHNRTGICTALKDVLVPYLFRYRCSKRAR